MSKELMRAINQARSTTVPETGAFPQTYKAENLTSTVMEPGLSKREYFAALALQGLLTTGYVSVIVAADHAVEAADALIEALNKEQK